MYVQVEAFHKVLKYIYMKGFANRRVDECLTLPMLYEKNKTFDRLVKLQKRFKKVDASMTLIAGIGSVENSAAMM